MATNTYVALATVTPSAVSSFVVMSSIPSTYTDLILVGQYPKSAANSARITFNSDSSSGLYSQTILYGNGTSALSNRETGVNYFYLMDYVSASTSNPNMSIVHIMNYANTTTYKTVLDRSGVADAGTVASAGLWRNNAAINRIDISTGGGTFSTGTTFTLYGVQAWAAEATPKATGGYVYSDSTYWYHAFPFTGAFTPITSLTADVMQVAGGGGAGYNYGAGGGAGGLLGSNSQSFVSATAYTVTVGAGGAGGTSSTRGSNGANSSIIGGAISLTATGGGGGGTAPGAVNGASGGSGGGGSGSSGGGGGGSGGAGTSGQGYAGAGTTGGYGGGGGGAGGAATGAAGANGSSAYSSWGLATGFGQNVGGTVYFAGGGSGTYSTGGYGGGGAYAVAGAVSTGGGAGPDSQPGGSGITIIRYAK